MANRKHVLAICGSLSKNSSNLNLIKVIMELVKDQFQTDIFEDLAEIPHFNPDHDIEPPPAPVMHFRNRLKTAHGILICTPEYAMGVPGTLKNAIDWTVSSCEFSRKPVALITASSMGRKAHESLLGTLRIIEAEITEQTQLLIPFIKSKISSAAGITDMATLEQVKTLMHDFGQIMEKQIPAGIFPTKPD
jgi:NAD(P)H-dependent FMN reductase